MAYDVFLSPATARQLRKLPDGIQEEIFKLIDIVAHNPRPVGCVKLRARNAYRLRASDYRMIYEIREDRLLVKILKIAHRSKAYR